MLTHEAVTSLSEGREDCRKDDSDSDSDNGLSNGSSKNLEEVSLDLMTDVECLMDLDPLIKAAVPDRKPPQVDPNTTGQPVHQDWTPHFVFYERISRRFPLANSGLITRLAEANLDRFLTMKQNRERNQLEQEQGKSATQEIRAENRVIGAAAVSEGGTKFHDSALGTSIATPSAYAETVMSYRQSGSSSTRIPSLPEGASEGNDFECVACGRLVVITTNSAWK